MNLNINQMLKPIFLSFRYLIILILLFYHIAAFAATQRDNPKSFIENLADQIYEIIQDDSLNRMSKLEKIYEISLTKIDFNWTARFVLATNWRKLNNSQQARFIELYKKYLFYNYGRFFAEETNIKWQVKDIRPIGKNKYAVRVEVALRDNRTLDLGILLIKHQNQEYKIIDVKGEEISIANAHRAEFREFIDKVDIENFIPEFEIRVNKLKEEFENTNGSS